MKIQPSRDPQILDLRSESVGCLAPLGILFFLSGLFVLAFVLGFVPLETRPGADMSRILLAVGGAGVILGLIFAGGRSGVFVDGRSRSMRAWSGLFVPMRRKERRLDGFTRVTLSKDVRKRSKGPSRTFFPVKLEGVDQGALTIDSGIDYIEARRLAEALARVLNRPLTDSSSGTAMVREPEHLDESLRERLDRLGERVEIAPRPHQMHSEAQILSTEVAFEIPGLDPRIRIGLALGVVLLTGGLSLLFFGAEFLPRNGEFSRESLMTLLPPMLFVMIPTVLLLGKLHSFGRRVKVAANRVALTVTEGRKTTVIPGEELEELSLAGRDVGEIFTTMPDGSLVVDPAFLESPAGAEHIAQQGSPPTIPPVLAPLILKVGALAPDRLAILARSDRASITFGVGLDTAELTYLYSAIVKVMAD